MDNIDISTVVKYRDPVYSWPLVGLLVSNIRVRKIDAFWSVTQHSLAGKHRATLCDITEDTSLQNRRK
jgi:hypothetical protein